MHKIILNVYSDEDGDENADLNSANKQKRIISIHLILKKLLINQENNLKKEFKKILRM